MCLLWGVEEVLLAALARMASGESEGLHGVSKTSRVSRDGECMGRRLWEQQDQPCPCVGFCWTQAGATVVGNESVVPFERIIFTTFKVYLITLKGHLCPFSEHMGFE